MMEKGRGFIQPNTALECKITQGAVVLASQLQRSTEASLATAVAWTRMESVKVDEKWMKPWRAGLEAFQSNAMPKKISVPSLNNFSIKNSADCSSEQRHVIKMKMQHYVGGEQEFEWVDQDGVGEAIVPKIEIDDAAAVTAAAGGEGVDPSEVKKWTLNLKDMTVAERRAYRRLLQLWGGARAAASKQQQKNAGHAIAAAAGGTRVGEKRERGGDGESVVGAVDGDLTMAMEYDDVANMLKRAQEMLFEAERR